MLKCFSVIRVANRYIYANMVLGGKQMYGCQQNLISPNTELAAILEFICSESHKLTNCVEIFCIAQNCVWRTV